MLKANGDLSWRIHAIFAEIWGKTAHATYFTARVDRLHTCELTLYTLGCPTAKVTFAALGTHNHTTASYFEAFGCGLVRFEFILLGHSSSPVCYLLSVIGASTIVMLYPSNVGRCSTTAISLSCSMMLLSRSRPMSEWVISRPRKRILTRTFIPSEIQRRASRILKPR